jgi:hypothetical protein
MDARRYERNGPYGRAHHWLLARLSAFKNFASWTWFERLSWIVVVFGASGFFVEHYFQLQRDKASATLEFVKRYQDAQLTSRRFALLEPWMSYDIKQMKAMGATRQDIDELVMKLIEHHSGNDTADIRAAIFDVVDFYQTLSHCIEAGRCDGDVAKSYFEEYAWRFYCLYRPYILTLKQQQNMPTYAERLRKVRQ